MASVLLVTSVIITLVSTEGNLSQEGSEVADDLLWGELIVIAVGHMVAIRVPKTDKPKV